VPHFAVQWNQRISRHFPPFLTETKGKTVQIIHTFSPFLTNVGLPRKKQTASVEKTIQKVKSRPSFSPNNLYLKIEQLCTTASTNHQQPLVLQKYHMTQKTKKKITNKNYSENS